MSGQGGADSGNPILNPGAEFNPANYTNAVANEVLAPAAQAAQTYSTVISQEAQGRQQLAQLQYGAPSNENAQYLLFAAKQLVKSDDTPPELKAKLEKILAATETGAQEGATALAKTQTMETQGKIKSGEWGRSWFKAGALVGGGAAAALGTYAVLNFWNPTGWVAGVAAFGVVVVGTAAGALGGAKLASSAGSAFGDTAGREEGLKNPDQRIIENIMPSQEQASFLLELNKFFKSDEQAYKQFFAMANPYILQQKVLEAIKTGDAQQIAQASEQYVVTYLSNQLTERLAKSYPGTTVSSAVTAGGVASNLTGMTYNDAKAAFAAIIGKSVSELTTDDLINLSLLRIQGYVNSNGGKLNASAYEIYKMITAEDSNKETVLRELVNVGEDLVSSKMQGFSGIFNVLLSPLKAAIASLSASLSKSVGGVFNGLPPSEVQQANNQNQGQGSGNEAEPTVSTTSITPDLVAGFTPPMNITGGQSVSQTQTPPRGGTANGLVLSPTS